MDITTATADLPKISKSHQWDLNIAGKKSKVLQNAVRTGDVEVSKKIEAILAEAYPHPKVRATVRPVDDGELANSVGACILGMISVTVYNKLNTFLSMRFATSFR